MLKTIKSIAKSWKENSDKKKAYRKLLSEMTIEEYRYLRGASAMLQKRKAFIDYSKSQCSSPAEYNRNLENREYRVIGTKENPTRRRSGLQSYYDNNRYEVTTHITPSINERMDQLENSKDFKKIQELRNKYL